MDDKRIFIPNELFAPAESSHFEGTYDLQTLTAGPDTYTFDGPVDWSIDVTNTGDAFLLTGTVSADAKTACARCCEDAEVSLFGEIEGYFLIADEGAVPDEMEEDEFEVLPADHYIDLEPLIVSALLVEIPLIPLCQEDCKGLCPDCGANLNDGPCGCTHDDDAAAGNPFAVLKNLDL